MGTKRLLELAATAVLMVAGHFLFPQIVQLFRGESPAAAHDGDTTGEWMATDGTEAEQEPGVITGLLEKVDFGRFGRYAALWAVLVLSELVKELGRGEQQFDLMRVLSFASFREMLHGLMTGEVAALPAQEEEVTDADDIGR